MCVCVCVCLSKMTNKTWLLLRFRVVVAHLSSVACFDSCVTGDRLSLSWTSARGDMKALVV